MGLPGLTQLQNNKWQSQEILGGIAAAGTLALLAKVKNVSALNALTSASAGLNAIPAAATANYIISAVLNRADEDKRNGDLWNAGKAFAATLLVGGLTVVANGTNIKETQFSKLPEFTKSLKPLAYASLAATTISTGGIQTVKAANSAYEARQARLAKEKQDRINALNAKAAKFTDADKKAVLDEAAVKAFDVKAFDAGKKDEFINGPKKAFIELAEAARAVLASKGSTELDVENRVTDEQIAWINAQAKTFNDHAENDVKIAGWVDLARKA